MIYEYQDIPPRKYSLTGKPRGIHAAHPERLKPKPRQWSSTGIPEHAPEPTAKFLAFAASCRELLSHYETGGNGALQHRTKLIHHMEERGSRRHPVQHYGDMRECAAALCDWMSTSQNGAFPVYRP